MTSEVCRNAADTVVADVTRKIDIMIEVKLEIIKRIQDEGGDPSNTFDSNTGEKRDLLSELRQAKEGREVVRKAVWDSAEKKCEDEGEKGLPGLLQNAFDLNRDILKTLTLNLFPEATFDVNAIDFLVKPFGGENAAIPKFREQMLNTLGVAGENNFIGDVIRSMGGSVIEDTGEVLEEIIDKVIPKITL